ncbi:uncharacterized protein LOC130428053 isoform X2 [Triplophysa dalaica]|uniref:uncharacterized protein LOC130428053 isoform X2 n=1 Tax=Triplophysa dalaica TaxID=1582913 RepID=UPI0024DF88C3|nr:uncharacterized protein LOC130428053 isoform X2 [Triplophysa dalaica]
MEKIYKLLDDYRLVGFYKRFIDFGIKDEQDFIDSVNEQTLKDLGLSQAELARYQNMITYLQRIGSTTHTPEMQQMPVMKALNTFHVFYRFPKCAERQEIRGLDPLQNTVDDMMLRICHENHVDRHTSVCLYTADGMALTDDPFFNTWSLKDRHIENGSELYSIFTPKENLIVLPKRDMTNIKNEGPDVIRCHIMLQGDFEIKVDLEHDTLRELKCRLSLESGIPVSVLHCSSSNPSKKLSTFEITEDLVLQFSLSTFDDVKPDLRLLFHNDVKPSVMQTQKGLSVFLSTLYAIKENHFGGNFKKVIAYIRKLSGCNALAQSLYQLICLNARITRNQKIAVVEGLYFLFREMLPDLNDTSGPKTIEDSDVFEQANICWANLIHQGKMNENADMENYATVSLRAYPTGCRMSEPVRIPGFSEVLERSYILEQIKEGTRIPNCSESNLQLSSIQRATDIEKILLSQPMSSGEFHLWICCHSSPKSFNFQVEQKKTFMEMYEDAKQFDHLIVTPPLQLLAMGTMGPRLVFLREDNLGLYISKEKRDPRKIGVYDCLSGKMVTENVEDLAHILNDVRRDNTFKFTKTPKEAIVVLFDSSSSMTEECYDTATQMKRIEAVKQIFDSFSNRSMAYDLPHVICLVKFNTDVKTILDFTENLETFKEQVHGIEASGCTRLYDALLHGISELEKVKQRFPVCRCRILCLTDGNDYRSHNNPISVTNQLMDKKIVVDAVLLGKGDNTVLHGISYVTGGYCFKPETAKAALKLLEMETVLSMEMRAERIDVPVSSIKNMRDLTGIFVTHGYDVEPQKKLPPQITHKVNRTESVLKTKIKESRTGHFMERHRRILEELKSLHCDPHPYCTVFPSETDFTFWRIIMKGPPETPYEKGVFELYCEFGSDYPVKAPLVRFFTPIYHCNINNVGRICHHIFDRNYSSDVTMREILDAVYGLLILPEAEDPLDSVLAEEFQTNKQGFEQAAKAETAKSAGQSVESIEMKYVGESSEAVPPHLLCPLSKQMFVDPVRSKYGAVYERKAIEEWLKTNQIDPVMKKPLSSGDLKQDTIIIRAIQLFRRGQVEETE